MDELPEERHGKRMGGYKCLFHSFIIRSCSVATELLMVGLLKIIYRDKVMPHLTIFVFLPHDVHTVMLSCIYSTCLNLVI